MSKRKLSYDGRPPVTHKAARRAWDYFERAYGRPPQSMGRGRNEFGQWNWVADYPPVRSISCYALNNGASENSALKTPGWMHRIKPGGFKKSA